MKLSVKIAVYFAAFALLLSVSAVLVTGTFMENEINHTERQWVATLAASLARPLSVDVINQDTAHGYQVIKSIAEQTEEISYIYIVGFDGRVFAHTFQGGFPKDLIEAVPAADDGSGRKVLFDGGLELVEYSAPLSKGMDARLYIGIDHNAREEHIAGFRFIVLGLLLILALTGGGLSFLIGRAIAKPIATIAFHMNQFGKGRLEGELKIPPAGPEVDRLVNSFNAMYTERRRSESELRRQAEILDQVHDSIVVADLDGTITSWNKGAERMYGYTAEEMIGRHDGEFVKRRKSGELFDANVSLSLLRDTSGEAYGFIDYSIDITARKRAETALKESREFLRTVFRP